MLPKNEILETLSSFYGTEAYHPTIIKNVIITDGVKYVADSCQAYWLIDLMASYNVQLKKDKVHGVVVKVTCQDGLVKLEGINMYNDHVEFAREFISSDFPLDEIAFYLVDNESAWVIALPSED